MTSITRIALILTALVPGTAQAQDHTATVGAVVAPAEQASTDRDTLAVLRAQVSGGAIFFTGAPQLVTAGEGAAATATFRSPQFSQSSTYLSFEAQPQLFAFGKRAGATDASYARYTAEPVINFRLTAIAVSDGTDEQMDGAAGIAPPDQSFLQSQKAALVQLGGLVAVHFGGTKVNDTAFHWSLGVSARRGFANVTDDQRQKRVWDLDDDLFGSRQFGGRLTLYSKKEADTAGRDWSPAAYVDAGVGRYESFEIATGLTPRATECLASRNACLAGIVPPQDEFATNARQRFYAEARLMLKNLYLGIDINNGAGRDDMRFIAGVTMQLESLFGR